MYLDLHCSFTKICPVLDILTCILTSIAVSHQLHSDILTCILTSIAVSQKYTIILISISWLVSCLPLQFCKNIWASWFQYLDLYLDFHCSFAKNMSSSLISWLVSWLPLQFYSKYIWSSSLWYLDLYPDFHCSFTVNIWLSWLDYLNLYILTSIAFSQYI